MQRWDIKVMDEYQAEAMQSNWCLTQEPVKDNDSYTVVRLSEDE
jgi:hypothetical protein